MSFTAAVFPIIAALATPEGIYFPTSNRWYAVNDTQTYFIERFFTKKSELSRFTDQELRSWVSQDYTELNALAQQNGFSIQFNPFGPAEFGALAIFNVGVTWISRGAVMSIMYDNVFYQATQLSTNFTVFEPEEYPYPIAQIRTTNNDMLYITPADAPLADFLLLQKISKLAEYIGQNSPIAYEYISFPQVAIDQHVDISWLLGMFCPNRSHATSYWKIGQAVQQITFRMDEDGAHVHSAAGIAFVRSCNPVHMKKLIIDRPFYLWIERPGCSIPIFAGYITPDNWVPE